jgi:ABC-type sugar transport system ATPase subunit
VSHRLDEVLHISDRMTVLRDGRVVGRLDRADASEEKLVRLVVGGERRRASGRARTPDEQALLRVSGVTLAQGVPPVDLEVRSGEIVGLAGLIGSGAAKLARMIGGADPLAGRVEIDGRRARIRTPRDAGRLGIGFIPEDRKGAGLVGDMSAAANMSLASLTRLRGRFGTLDHRAFTAMAERYRTAMEIRLPSIWAPVRTLSGGNQQKVMIARWLASGVRILAVEEPTHGVDVDAKVQIHNLLRTLADDGGALIVASTDTRELLHLCDRIVVFRHGQVTDVVLPSQLGRAEPDGKVTHAERALESLIGAGRRGDALAAGAGG